METSSLTKLNIFFDKYIDQMLIKDINLIKGKNEEFKFTYPYILLACSGIDFFGGIEKGFNKRPLSERFTWFITEWMGRINSLYRQSSIADLIYDSLRCGVVHQAIPKIGFMTGSQIALTKKHLHFISGEDRIFVHAIQFADDFIQAQNDYRKYINGRNSVTEYLDSLYTNLREILDSRIPERGKEFETAKNYLITNKFVTDKSTITTASGIVTESITMLPDNDAHKAIPSAAPNEDDLK